MKLQTLISFGALLGKLGPTQLMFLAVIETIVYSLNIVAGTAYIGAVDVGGSLFVHAFGGVFGLAAARAFYREQHVSEFTLIAK